MFPLKKSDLSKFVFVIFEKMVTKSFQLSYFIQSNSFNSNEILIANKRCVFLCDIRINKKKDKR